MLIYVKGPTKCFQLEEGFPLLNFNLTSSGQKIENMSQEGITRQCSQLGTMWPPSPSPGGRLTMSGDTFGCPKSGGAPGI